MERHEGHEVFVADQTPYLSQDEELMPEIEMRHRLVQQHDRRVLHKGTSDEHELLFPAAQPGIGFVPERLDPGLPQGLVRAIQVLSGRGLPASRSVRPAP